MFEHESVKHILPKINRHINKNINTSKMSDTKRLVRLGEKIKNINNIIRKSEGVNQNIINKHKKSSYRNSEHSELNNYLYYYANPHKMQMNQKYYSAVATPS